MSERLKIAQVVPTYPPYRGGMGQVVHEYAVRLRSRGHSVEVFTPRSGDTTGEADFVHRLYAPVRRGNAGFVPSLFRLLRQFDLVHLHLPFFGGAEPTLFRKLVSHRQGLLVTYHMDAAAQGLKGILFALHERLVLPRILARADRVLVSSMDYAERSAVTQVGTRSRVEVHPFGVDVERFRPGTEPRLRSSLGIASDDVVLLFVARLDAAHHFKGLSVLLEALRDLGVASWRLVVVGDGPTRSAFERLAAANGLATRVHFAGDVDACVLPTYYRLADLHVFPSTGRSEAFGLVCLEAAATGIPTIASDLAGVRTVVRNGETGVLVPAGEVSRLRDGIRELTTRAKYREGLGKAARDRAEAHFGWEPLVTRLEETYRAVEEALGARQAL